MEQSEAEVETTEVGAEEEVVTYSYVVNVNSKKFHYSWCSSVSDMAEENKWYANNYSRDELIEMGYEPCKRCNP